MSTYRLSRNLAASLASGLPLVATVAVVGSIDSAASMPPECQTSVINGVAYQICGGTWYQPQYAGSQVNYVVINAPG
jgi:hypothetical protein